LKGRYRYRNKKNRYDKFHGTGQSTVLVSGYTVDQTWKGLSKAWLGYTIAKDKEEDDKLIYYASVIQKLRKELGLPPENFSHLDFDEDITKEKKEKSNRKQNSENDNNHKKKSRVHRKSDRLDHLTPPKTHGFTGILRVCIETHKTRLGDLQN
jgi:hypothetical protein